MGAGGTLVFCFVELLITLAGSSTEPLTGLLPDPSLPVHRSLVHVPDSFASLVRFRRQSSCNNGFACDDGQCIPRYSVCDGEKDCTDGSDETSKECGRNPKCPSMSFRCAYGACISGDQKCNGRDDCADGSDEKGCRDTGAQTTDSSCGIAKFHCNDGACIDQYKVCDGSADCADGSDETIRCRQLFSKCPSKSFRCTYGACVDQGAYCNKVRDCADGSDEVGCPGDTTARPPLPVSGTGSCLLPDHPYNRYSSSEYSSLGAGSRVRNNGYVVVQCEGQQQAGSRCESGQWNPPIRKCHKFCPPLTSTTLDLKCWFNGGVVSCDQKHRPNTRITYACKLHHKPAGDPGPLTDMTCQQDGTWTKTLPKCISTCGKSNLNSGVTIKPTIVNGTASDFGNFPWQAGLFLQQADASWLLSCGGSLITPNSVLTAAHCVTDRCDGCRSPPISESRVIVALGKIRKGWDEKDEPEIRVKVKKLFVHENYYGRSFNFMFDIAVLRLKEDVPVSGYIMPVCIDELGAHTHELTQGPLGYVVGWGNTLDCSQGQVCEPSNVLQHANTSVVDFSTCYNKTQSILWQTTVADITYDKFCTADSAESVVQSGDSGGGIFFQFDRRFYVYGIVSMKFSRKGKYSVGAFTNVSLYLDWILEKNSVIL